jgi:hypothetical protein
MPTTPVVTAGNAELRLKFLTTDIPLDPLLNFVTYPINITLMTTSMLGTIIVSTHVVVVLALSD